MVEIDNPVGTQSSQIDDGLACLLVTARFHGIATDPSQLVHQYGGPSGFREQEILLAARAMKLRAKSVRSDVARLVRSPLPAIASGGGGQFVVVARADSEGVLVHDPQVNAPRVFSMEEWKAWWSGQLLLFSSQASLAGSLARFDFSWFIPAVVKYRRLLGEVMLVSLALQLIALATPLFFQVVMDKVLVHKGTTTLTVIGVGLLACSIFETALSGLRTYVFAHTTSRIDIELGSRLFKHLVTLPLAYFQARRVGDSVARVRELENIRAFLTGNAITLVMDVLFSFVFIGVMLLYSGLLTAVVVASLPVYVALSMIYTPTLRSRLKEKFNRGAENQAFLVESIAGIQTLKAMAVEPQIQRQWDQQLAAYVSSGFRTTSLGTVLREGVGLTGKLVTVATIWIGAKEVMSGDLTVGQLVAFNMLAGRVGQPIMRIAQLWTDFQQTGVSMQRLGDILNAPTENPSSSRSPLGSVEGRIDLENVVFRYRPDGQEVLKGVNLSVLPGEVVGIVGRSGSGKSTVTKLIQRLHLPERGRVLVDGTDLAMADVASLRRQIGVVLQDNVLFNRSVRDNIALTDPGVPLEEVVAAAKLAGAHDFILELPEGYDTIVGEQGASLSGGQRQRVAIARALLGDPRILIFDEATSALDYESERIIQTNMRSICAGRTVIIIAHRLSAVRDANRIVVMDHGQIVEEGSHSDLLAHQTGPYARLYRMQQA